MWQLKFANKKNKGSTEVYRVLTLRMTLPGVSFDLDLITRSPGPLPLTAAAITALRSLLLATPRVLCAASVNAALTVGFPAPGAERLLEKMVTCFFAATAITMTAILPLPGISSCAGFNLIQLAGIFYTFKDYVLICCVKGFLGRRNP